MLKIFKVKMELDNGEYDLPAGYTVDQILCANHEDVVMVIRRIQEENRRGWDLTTATVAPTAWAGDTNRG